MGTEDVTPASMPRQAKLSINWHKWAVLLVAAVPILDAEYLPKDLKIFGISVHVLINTLVVLAAAAGIDGTQVSTTLVGILSKLPAANTVAPTAPTAPAMRKVPPPLFPPAADPR